MQGDEEIEFSRLGINQQVKDYAEERKEIQRDKKRNRSKIKKLITRESKFSHLTMDELMEVLDSEEEEEVKQMAYAEFMKKAQTEMEIK